ncbi:MULTISPECIES: hypothetical protein [unclassified Methanosarcina]|uniref:hypothetical protein n=1 Tax=unclassified Methanosarcina TaxID=2644672 RepID=UPI0009E3FE51|nr:MULTISPECIES: hypothetical protein [unclassified Methanosarcina]
MNVRRGNTTYVSLSGTPLNRLRNFWFVFRVHTYLQNAFRSVEQEIINTCVPNVLKKAGTNE